MPSQGSSQLGVRIGRNVRAARLAKGLTQRELANAVSEELESMAVSRWERGVAVPNLPNLLALAGALGVEPADLYREPAEEAVA